MSLTCPPWQTTRQIFRHCPVSPEGWEWGAGYEVALPLRPLVYTGLCLLFVLCATSALPGAQAVFVHFYVPSRSVGHRQETQ